MSEQKHMPTPWSLGRGPLGEVEIRGRMRMNWSPVIASMVHDPREANAEFIVRAVNSYDTHRALIAELVEALGETRKAIASLDEWALGGAVVEHTDGGGIADQYPIRDELLSNIDAALAKAKAESAP